MKMLYNETHTWTNTYHYEISGELTESGTVTIIFVDNIFYSASYPFRGTYTRNGWRILAAINEKINEIEKQLEQALKGGGQAAKDAKTG